MVTINSLGSTVTIVAEESVVEAGVGDDVALVGGYDASNTGSNFSAAGDAHTIETTSDAKNTFGNDSELHRAVASVSAHDVGTIYCVPVPETTGVTETFGSTTATSSGTLSEVPFDPKFNAEHDITATDVTAGSSVTVNVVYEDPVPSPSGTNEMNLNPNTRAWVADEAAEYDITYDHGTYASSIETAAQQDTRFVGVLSSDSGHHSTLQTELNEEETNFDLRRGVVNGTPSIDVGSISSYTPNEDSYRVIEAVPAHATNSVGDVRYAASVTGLLAGQPVNVEGSVLYETDPGVTGFDTQYPPTDAANFDRVVAASRDAEIANADTTSSTEEFQSIYAMEIADLVAESLYLTVKQYAGGPNLQEDREDLYGGVKRLLNSYWTQRPALLASGDGTQPYDIRVTAGVDDTTVNVETPIEPAPIMEQINLDISVGNVVTMNGVTA